MKRIHGLFLGCFLALAPMQAMAAFEAEKTNIFVIFFHDQDEKSEKTFLRLDSLMPVAWFSYRLRERRSSFLTTHEFQNVEKGYYRIVIEMSQCEASIQNIFYVAGTEDFIGVTVNAQECRIGYVTFVHK